MMTRMRNAVLLCPFLVILSLLVAPARAAQNTWEVFWDGMETALVTLGTNPTQAYFDTLYDPGFPNRDQLFQSLVAEANALSDMQISYSIFISEDNRAAYQRVVTGVSTQPYVFGNTTLPPTSAPLRFVTQGMMDANGDGKITADYSVTDGFAKFQDFGALALALDQEHGQLSLEPLDPALVDFYRDNPEGQIGLPFAVFPYCIYNNRDLFDEAGLDYPPQALDAPDDGNADQAQPQALYEPNYARANERFQELVNLLTIDENGNDATMPEFDPENVVQQGFGRLWFTETPEISLNAAVHQGDWSAGYFTFTTQPGTGICVDIFEQPLTLTDAMQIPAFAFVHTNADNEIDLAFLNFDVLGITNQLRINPTLLDLAPMNLTVEEQIELVREALENAPVLCQFTVEGRGFVYSSPDRNTIAGYADDMFGSNLEVEAVFVTEDQQWYQLNIGWWVHANDIAGEIPLVCPTEQE